MFVSKVNYFFIILDDRDGAFLDEKMSALAADLVHHSGLNAPGISRQQLINRFVKFTSFFIILNILLV